MADTRRKDMNWKLPATNSVDFIQLAVLMDIRDELKELNLRFRCPDFIDIPDKLDAIKRNTARPRRKRK